MKPLYKGDYKMKDLDKPITKCKDCGHLYLKFDHLPTPQPCPHCLTEEINNDNRYYNPSGPQ